MKKVRQKLPVIFLILLAALFIPGVAHAGEFQGKLWDFKKTIKKTSGAFTYYAYPSKNQKEAWIYKINIKGGKNCSKLSIPSKLDNKKVTRLGSREVREREEDEVYNIFDVSMEPWHPYNNGESTRTKRIKKLILPNTIKVIQPTTFGGMDSIKEVKIPKSVQILRENTFYHCDKLKKVELPAKLKSLHIMAFMNCPKLTDIKLSPKNKTYQVKGKCVITKKKKELVYAATGGQTLEIPEGVKVLKPYAFMNCTFATVHIPASVKKIEAGAFSDHWYESGIFDIGNVTVDDKNSVYARDGQCIYNKKDKSLTVAIMDEKGVLYIPDQVERMTGDRDILEAEMPEDVSTKVVYPKNLKTVVDYGFISADYIYFTGEKPPKLVKEKNKRLTSLPKGHVYVPAGSEEVYRQWYKKYKSYDELNSFNTFKPEDTI